MDSEEMKEGLQKSKKLLIGLGVVILFAVYMLWPESSTPVVQSTDLDEELAALQASRSGSGSGGFVDSSFDGIDRRGVEIGSSGGDGDGVGGSVYETSDPDITGVLVGYGTQTDSRGQYLVAYLQKEDEQGGYEVDLREVQRYDLQPPTIWEIDDTVSVFGTQEEGNRFRARSIR